MVKVRYGGKKGQALSLVESPTHIVVRTANRGLLAPRRTFGAAPLKKESREILGDFECVSRYTEAGVEVLRMRDGGSRKKRDRARAILQRDPALEFAGRVMVDRSSGRPFIYTENFFVKFDDELGPRACAKILKNEKLAVKRALGYAKNAYFVQAPAGTGLQVFDIAEALLELPEVELCHPELVRDRRARRAFDQQWHLKETVIGGKTIKAHANVEAAWALSQGEGIVIAVIDDGVDVDHDEFRSSAKIVSPRDITRGVDDPRPKGLHDDHGTACAGVACADGNFGASGVAPRARLMPIRLASELGSQAEADAFVWAADHGADVISCSWGPSDGDFLDPSDPLHAQVEPLPDSTRLAMEYAFTRGRNGRGCVILFAAGNGNESVDNDGYASHPKVIAVAACDDRGKKAPYSDFGRAVFCAFPSNHYHPSATPGIWTTDRLGGLGYNSGDPRRGDPLGKYTNNFGGTSSACPGAAGVAALVLARNPELRFEDVRDILRRSADRIDVQGGRYDAEGRSPFYGFGRLNALRAVELALPEQALPLAVFSAVRDVPIVDLGKAELSVQVASTKLIRTLKVGVNLEHTWVGDLRVRLIPPAALGLQAIVLHDRAGSSADDIKRSYDPVSTPALAALVGEKPEGTWRLEVTDNAARDQGTLRSFTLELGS
jgi:subtilisin family serine protease